MVKLPGSVSLFWASFFGKKVQGEKIGVDCQPIFSRRDFVKIETRKPDEVYTLSGFLFVRRLYAQNQPRRAHTLGTKV